MEILKRKILRETLISRENDVSYGTITAATIYLKVFLTQDIDDMGMYTDMEYVNRPWETPASIGNKPNLANNLVNELVNKGLNFPFMSGATTTEVPPPFNKDLRTVNRVVSDFYTYGMQVTGFTNNKLNEYVTTLRNQKYRKGYIAKSEVYTNFLGVNINGISTITSPNNPVFPKLFPVVYTKLGNNDNKLGTVYQTTGIKYVTYPSPSVNETINIDTAYGITDLRNFISPTNPDSVDTVISYIGEGFNPTNTTLSAITKEELYFGIVSEPEVTSDVFIDRGSSSVMDKHLRLSEIVGVQHLVRYGNKFYNINENNLE